MIQSILSTPYIEGVAVGQEGLTTQLLYKIHHGPGVVGSQIGQISRFPKVELNGNVLVLKVDFVHACRQDQAAQLLLKILSHSSAESGKINLCFFHGSSSLNVGK